MAEKQIVLADMDTNLREELAARLLELGFNVRATTDGVLALIEVVDAPPDLLILEANLPGLNGLSVCRRLMENPKLAPIPVILLTSETDHETVRKCCQIGVHYLHKGLDVWSRLRTLTMLLLDVPDDQSDAVASEARSSASETDATLAYPRVLMIDDDPQCSRALQIQLNAYGVEVIRAFNGTQGYWMALKTRPDVVITDFNMPEGCGNYVIGRLKSHSLTRNIPIIVLTGRTVGGGKDTWLDREMHRLGASCFLTKPLELNQLLTELRKHIPIQAAPESALAISAAGFS